MGGGSDVPRQSLQRPQHEDHVQRHVDDDEVAGLLDWWHQVVEPGRRSGEDHVHRQEHRLGRDEEPERGKADVWVDGVKVATVDLYRSSFREQQIASAKIWTTNATHTIEVRGLGTPGDH